MRARVCVCERSPTHMYVSAFGMTHDGLHALLKRLLTSVSTSGIQPERQIEEERRITQILINHISTSASSDLCRCWGVFLAVLLRKYASSYLQELISAAQHLQSYSFDTFILQTCNPALWSPLLCLSVLFCIRGFPFVR